MLADYFRNDFPDVADFLERLRYVDDMAKSVSEEEEATKTIEDTEKVLNTVNMKVKGWSVTGEILPQNLQRTEFQLVLAA